MSSQKKIIRILTQMTITPIILTDYCKSKKLLMLTATEQDIPFILAAKKLGYFVITTGNRPEYAGHRYGDQYVNADFSDYEGMVELCRKMGIDALSWATSDPCALAACYIGEKLGLKGHDTFENAQIIHLKDRFKEFAARNGVKTPLARYFTDVAEAKAFSDDASWPLIVKPVDLAGGKGVSVVRTPEEYLRAVDFAFGKSFKKRIVAEPFIEGTLHSLNTFIVDRKVRAFCTANDYPYLNKYMTTSGVSPADRWEEAVKTLIPETERVAELLGLVDGQLHMQYIMRDGEPFIIEMMRRNIGNYWSSMINDAVGVNWAEWCIRAEAGLDCHHIPASRMSKGFYGYHMMQAAQNGVFRGIEIEPEFEKHVYQVVMWAQPGHSVSDYLYDKLGNVLFHFDTAEEKDWFMPRINELVKVIVE